jgi:hypothetical protein
MIEHATEQTRTPWLLEFIVAIFGLATLLVGQWMLSTAIHGSNYYGPDGMMAQAITLAAVKFAGIFDVTNLSPINGVGSQMLPKNLWANPSLWPFAFTDRELATDISALIALAIFVVACYVMARCFDMPVVPSAVSAQLCIVLFAPTLLRVHTPTNFCLTPADAVVYAPYMAALGLLARIEAGSWRRFALMTGGIVALVLYSIYCDPLFTFIAGVGWVVPFAVVTFGSLRIRTSLVRCAAMATCFGLLLLSGVLIYLYTLVQFTARVQYPEMGDRAREIVYVSAVSYSPDMKYLYLACVVGWVFGLLSLRGRARLLVAAAMLSAGAYLMYSLFFLLLNVAWKPPIPIYVEHCLIPLYMTAAIAGYWGVLRLGGFLAVEVALAITRFARSARLIVQRTVESTLSRLHDFRSTMFRLQEAPRSRGFPKLAISLSWAVSKICSRVLGRIAASPIPVEMASMRVAVRNRTSHFVFDTPRFQSPLVALVAGLVVTAIIPATAAKYALLEAGPIANVYQWPWPKEPEIAQFFSDKLGQEIGKPFRGSVHFYVISVTGFSLNSLGVPTIEEYSQLVSPQAYYYMYKMFDQDLTGSLNGFSPWPRSSSEGHFWKVLQMFGARYYVTDDGRTPFAEEMREVAVRAGFPTISVPRRAFGEEPGIWQIHELPHPNVGDYSPTEMVVSDSAAEIVDRIREPDFDVTRQVVLSTVIGEALVPARDMRFSRIRGALHVAGHSDGTSLVVLPQQFSNCLHARDRRARLVRANLMMTGIVFSGDIDTDILFDYGLFTPYCRLADLRDIKWQALRIDLQGVDRRVPTWEDSLARLRAAVEKIR